MRHCIYGKTGPGKAAAIDKRHKTGSDTAKADTALKLAEAMFNGTGPAKKKLNRESGIRVALMRKFANILNSFYEPGINRTETIFVNLRRKIEDRRPHFRLEKIEILISCMAIAIEKRTGEPDVFISCRFDKKTVSPPALASSRSAL